MCLSFSSIIACFQRREANANFGVGNNKHLVLNFLFDFLDFEILKMQSGLLKVFDISANQQ